MAEFVMPALGSDMTEGKLIEWKKRVGDQVKKGDILAEVDTEKAAIEEVAHDVAGHGLESVVAGNQVVLAAQLALQREGAQLHLLAIRDDGADRRDPVLAELGLDQGERQLGAEDRDVGTLAKQVRQRSDVVLDNFRPGVMERLGLSHEELSRRNPRIVACSLSSFGEEGPLKDHPAFDLVIQAMSGAMSVTGEPGWAPVRMGKGN